MLAIRITPGSPMPIYQQIVTQVRHAVGTGGVGEGELLPSVRALAEQLLINPNTVAKAYADLSKDALVEAVPGKGLAVAARRAGMGLAKAERLGGGGLAVAARRAGMGLAKAERLRRVDPLVTQLVHDAISLELSAGDLQELLNKK